MYRHRRIAIIAILGALAGCTPHGAVNRGGSAPLLVSGSVATLEIAPVLLAARNHFPAGAVVRNGGIPNLIGVPPTPEFGEVGSAHVATHAETQALRYSVAHPDIRIILTVTEGSYRIIARRSAGIAQIADLKGKRIATLATTSAGYFLAQMLAQERLSFSDVTPVRISPIEDMAKALDRGEVDAVAIWEPHGENAARVLGDDIVTFSGDGVYRELFNLNTIAGNLRDPVMRPRIVAFVRAVMEATAQIQRDPTSAQALVASASGIPADEIVGAWPTLAFPAALPTDLLDVLVAEEQWLAVQDNRAPRSRETLSTLIDASVYAEALELGPL